MADNNEYLHKLLAALKARAEWLEKNEIPKLKDGIKIYRTSFAFLYNLFIKNGLIREDPYKNDVKIEDIQVPNAADFKDEDKLDQLTTRLAQYDNQLEYLLNGCEINAEFLTLDRIKKLTALLKYIDWTQLSGESMTPVTKSIAKMTGEIMTGNDAMTLKITTESLANLNKNTAPIMGGLKLFADYQKESYKLDLRDVTVLMPAAEASNVAEIKKKFTQLKQGTPFYQEFAEEVIKEDHSKDGPNLKAAILKKLQVAETKQQTAKPTARSALLEGIQILANMTGTFSHIADVMDGNQAILNNKKKSFMEVLKELFSKSSSAVTYEVKYIDHTRGVPVYEKVNFTSFRADLDKKIHTLTAMSPHGAAAAKIEAMQDEQLVHLLEHNMREIQSLYKILAALDEFFKTSVDQKDRDKIRGIKAELETIKSAIQRANAKRHDYSDKKEEEQHPKK